MVRDQHDGCTRALKLLDNMSDVQVRRLMVEAGIQIDLRHRNVVEVYAVLSEGEHLGLVMEYVDGPTLTSVLQRRRLTFDELDSLAQGILRGVRAAHRRGSIHRDLKPSNILLQRTEKGLVPKVTDFGLAKVLVNRQRGRSITQSGQMMGSPPYMSPEQIRNSKKVDARADVFSLGVILYQMATGDRPFHREDIIELFACISSGTYAPAQDVVPELPLRMASAIDGALLVDIGARIQSVEEFLDIWLDRTRDRRSAVPDSTDRHAALVQSIEEDAEPFPLSPYGPAWMVGLGFLGVAFFLLAMALMLLL